jgi:sialidase-1
VFGRPAGARSPGAGLAWGDGSFPSVFRDRSRYDVAPMNPLRILASLSIACCMVAADEPSLERSEVFPPGFNGIARYRIPGIVVTTNGTVLAYCEARKNDSKDWGEIEVHLRRSTDGGKTWLPSQHIAHQAERIEGNPHKAEGGEYEQTVNNPVAIVDRATGAIEFLYCVNYARCFSMRSSDDGATWSEPVEITASFEPFRAKVDWKVIATGPGHGIQMKSGRLVVPIWLAYGGIGDHKPSAAATIYSDNHGRTWKAGDLCLPNEGDLGDPNETMIAELSDGRVMLVARSVSQASRKIITTSADGASGWSHPVFHDQLWEPICMASIVAHPSGALLFSNPHTLGLDEEGKPVPAGRGKRENLSIKLSRDDGKTWPINKTLEPGKAAYSDLAVLPDGTVLCLFERADSIDCARFNLEWVKQP